MQLHMLKTLFPRGAKFFSNSFPFRQLSFFFLQVQDRIEGTVTEPNGTSAKLLVLPKFLLNQWLNNVR